MNQDFVDLLRAFREADVRFIVVGAYALALHAKPRATGALDLWVEPTIENGTRVIRALKQFGAPLQEVKEADFAVPGTVFQIGVAPRRIDILTSRTGLNFRGAWEDRVHTKSGPARLRSWAGTPLSRTRRRWGAPKILPISNPWMFRLTTETLPE